MSLSCRLSPHFLYWVEFWVPRSSTKCKGWLALWICKDWSPKPPPDTTKTGPNFHLSGHKMWQGTLQNLLELFQEQYKEIEMEDSRSYCTLVEFLTALRFMIDWLRHVREKWQPRASAKRDNQKPGWTRQTASDAIRMTRNDAKTRTVVCDGCTRQCYDKRMNKQSKCGTKRATKRRTWTWNKEHGKVEQMTNDTENNLTSSRNSWYLKIKWSLTIK